MTTATIDHIVIDDQGRAKIRGTRMRVTDIIEASMVDNMTAEQLCREFPDIPRAAIYAAFAYYYDHQEELDEEIERGDN